MYRLLPLLLAGCVTAASFPKQQAAEFCKRLEDCSPAEFEAAFDDQKGCRDDYEDSIGPVASCQRDACKFDSKDASECLKAIKGATCDSLYSGSVFLACESVYDECDQVDLGVCLALTGFGFDSGF